MESVCETHQQFKTCLKQWLKLMDDETVPKPIRYVIKRGFGEFLYRNQKHMYGSFIIDLRRYCLNLTNTRYFTYPEFVSLFLIRDNEKCPSSKQLLESLDKDEITTFNVRVISDDDHTDKWYEKGIRAWSCYPELARLSVNITDTDYQVVISTKEVSDANVPVIKGPWGSIEQFAKDSSRKMIEILNKSTDATKENIV